MNKEKFKYLYSFKYNNKDYIYLVSKNYPFYFLEYNSITQNFEYPDDITFIELYSKFYLNNSNNTYDIKSTFKLIKEKLHNIHFDVKPLIKTTSGLVSIAIVLSLCGCTQTKELNKTNNPEESTVAQVQDKDEEIYNYFKSYNMEVTNREYDGNDYIFVTEFINSDNKKQITLNNFEEFRTYKNIDFIPKWDNVITAFQSNPNIDEEKRKIILDSLNNIRNNDEFKDLDLTVLYANAQRMSFKYLSSEELIATVHRESVYAYFDTETGIVYLPSDKPFKKFEFIHEVLGHGALAFREENNNSLIVFDCTNYLMLPTDGRYTGYSFGSMINEGGANLIAHLATNDYSVSTFYELYEEELRVIAKLCNISLGQLFNHKGISLYDLMYKNNISTPIEYIFKMDGILKGQLYCEFSDLMERLFVDATEERYMNANEQTQNEIIKSTVEIIKGSHFKNRQELNYKYPGGSINYNFENIANKYEDNMSQLKTSK